MENNRVQTQMILNLDRINTVVYKIFFHDRAKINLNHGTAKMFLITLLLIFITGCTVPKQATYLAMPVGQITDEPEDQVDSSKKAVKNKRYHLMIGDQLEVRYLRQLEYSTTVTVGVDGTILLPFLSSIVAEGRSIDELRNELEQKYLDLANASPSPGSKKYLLVVGDVLKIKFPFLNEYTDTVIVSPDGKISLPMLDSVLVEGKSADEVEKELIKRYSKHLDKGVPVVNIVSSTSNVVFINGKQKKMPPTGMDSVYLTLKSAIIPKVYVAGEVVHPAAIPYQPKLSSLQAIITAGGITGDGELQSVIIVRKGRSGTPRYIVRNLQSDIDGEPVIHSEGQNAGLKEQRLSVTNDIVLRPFDVVIVPKTNIANVRDTLNRYIYDLIPPLRNSSLGFNYTKVLGTQKVRQETIVVP